MYNKKRVAVIVFITFLLTTLMYTAAYTIVPAVPGFLENVKTYIGGKNPKFVSKFNEVQGYIDKCYLEDYDTELMNDYALTGYVAGLGDMYSEYISKDNFKTMQEDLSGNYKGIGVEIYFSDDNYMTVSRVTDGSPAQKAGIVAGDKFISVNGTEVNEKTYLQVVDLMRGKGEKSNNKIKITVLRDGSQTEYMLKRAKIKNQSVSTKMLENNIGYMSISEFSDKTGEDFDRLLNLLISDGAKSLIIDLRDNPGGTLNAVLSVADKILGKGKILTIKDKNGNKTVYNSDKNQINLPICLLINENSASASEVLAGALKDHKKATLIGTKSFGKGIVQSVFNLSDGSALKITTSKYYTPNGKCIHKKGIEPDITIDLNTNKPISALTASEDIQLQKAIDFLIKGKENK